MLKIEKLNNVLTGFATNLLGTLSMFLVTIYLTRTVDQSIYGEFRLAFSFISLMVVLLLLGRDNGVVYYTQLVSTERDKNTIISQESFFTLVILFLGTCLLFVFKELIIYHVFNDNISNYNYSLSLLMLPLWGWFNMGIAALKAKQYINYSFTLTNFIQRVIRVPFFLVFVFISESFISLTLSMLFSQLVLLFLMIKKVPSIIYFKKVYLKHFLLRFKYGIQLGLSSIIFVVLSKIDVIMLGKLTNVSNVAVYDICTMLSMVVIFPYIALVKSSEPVVKSIIENIDKLKNYKKNLNLSVNLASIVVLIFITNSTLILSIFGEEYKEGSTSLIILGIGYLLVSFLASPIEFLNMSGHVKKSLRILVLSLFINVVLNYYLIPIYGLNGAAYATVTSLIVTKVIALILVKNSLGLSLVSCSDLNQILPFFISLIAYLLIFKNFEQANFYVNILLSIAIVLFCVFLILNFNKDIFNKLKSFIK